MTRYAVVGVLLALVLVVAPASAQDEAAEAPTVSMTADAMSAADVAAEIEEQTGVQVAVTEWTEGSLTGTLRDFTVENAVSSMGQATNSSWLRFYMLESAPPDEPYTAAELLVKLGEARSAWLGSLTDEQRQALAGGMRGARGEDGEPGMGQGGPPAEPGGERGARGPGDIVAGPGGAIAMPPAPEGAEDDPGARFRAMGEHDDPLRGLLQRGRTDEITLELTDAPLDQALTEFMLASRFLVVAEEGLTGEVTLQLEDAPVAEALAAIAEAAGAQWRAVYIVSSPRQLTQQEIVQREVAREQRREEAFNQRWTEFWQQSPAERAAEIQSRVERMERGAERMQQRIADNPRAARRWQGRMQQGLDRRMTQMMNYTNRLTPEQRLELKPLLEAMSRMGGGR